MMVELLFCAMPWGCLRFVIVVYPDHTHLLFSTLKPFVPKNKFLLLVLSDHIDLKNVKFQSVCCVHLATLN